eukprot:TRINITY_DN22101_c0_g1_i1.p1 TRINITY_DN22101_c0_g1~~TRINITY_DN22101_c0_g1_i1.p1  ORF type:complete len:421 (+),score=48.18 TRINITY_DN22101_c0_g1_i1:78-1340(+)
MAACVDDKQVLSCKKNIPLNGSVCLEESRAVGGASSPEPKRAKTEVDRRDRASSVKSRESTYFDPTLRPPPIASNPQQIVVLMRHGDRTPIPQKIGQLDISHQCKAWEELLLGAEEQQTIDSVRVSRSQVQGNNAYAAFVGDRPWGQLTSIGFTQCQNVGRELRRRYPRATEVQAFSTDFPRTIQSAASTLAGMANSENALPLHNLHVQVRSPSEETLLPNFDGACKRYSTLRAERVGKLPEKLRNLAAHLDERLTSVVGENPRRKGNILDFKPFCVHEGSVGSVRGLDWELVDIAEHYFQSIESHVFEDTELLKLACGRLVGDVVETLREPGHRITLMLAHDNMLTAFLLAIGVREQQWPLYASVIMLETAMFDDRLKLRILMNDEVCSDWKELDLIESSLCAHVLSKKEYLAACESGR